MLTLEATVEGLKLLMLGLVAALAWAAVGPFPAPPRATPPVQMRCFPSDALDIHDGWEFCPDQWDYETRRT